MHRNGILNLLEVYMHQNSVENNTINEFVSFIKSHSNCFDRTLAVGHITGSGWLVNNEGTKVLLTHHKNLNKWLQLGGHADGQSDVLMVAMREVEEESGLLETLPISKNIFDIDAHLIPAKKNDASHIHYDIRFAFKVTGSEQYIVSNESHDLAWIDIDDVKRYSDEDSLLRMVSKWKLLKY